MRIEVDRWDSRILPDQLFVDITCQRANGLERAERYLPDWALDPEPWALGK